MKNLPAPFHDVKYVSLVEAAGGTLQSLPYSLRVLLEGSLRHGDTPGVKAILSRDTQRVVAVRPARVLLQDFTGVPVIVDLAAMRAEVARRGGDPTAISPVIPVDAVVDHSLQVDFTGVPDAIQRNLDMEFERNRERYALLQWAQQAFRNLRVVPPGKGIIHQVNIEYLADVVTVRDGAAFPDFVFGTDSHTTMVNGLGVLGWGVGGIEAAAAMLGNAVDIVLPKVTGVKLTGALQDGVTPTDLTLTIVEQLRKIGVVGQFVEYFGPGARTLSLPDRAMIANMTPEFGATAGYFPIDEKTLAYLRLTGRSEKQVLLVEAYARAQKLFHTAEAPVPQYDHVVEIDLSAIEPSLAGPTRPQDRIAMREMKAAFHAALRRPKAERGFGVKESDVDRRIAVDIDDQSIELKHGSLLIAAITSCTNTSNPTVILTAGLVAKKAVEHGLTVNPAVKCSLNPGSRVVTRYLEASGLLKPLAALGFNVSGYGCATCIGNAGPLREELTTAAAQHSLIMASVASANRNFEGRISPHTRANYLASPPLVVAYALAGRVDIDLTAEPIGIDKYGAAVFLSDLYPSADEVAALYHMISPEMFRKSYADLFDGDERWKALSGGSDALYAWDEHSTYIQQPPYFSIFDAEQHNTAAITGARVLLKLGDSITTDHISPAGVIPRDSDAAAFLEEQDVAPWHFNSFGSRRGNDRVMERGTFANVRIKNQLVPGKEGGITRYLPTGETMTVYRASQHYKANAIPLLVLAGKEYGTGSSRDWAAKGPLLLGVRAILAESFERIHRSNLVGMGILPLQYRDGENADALGLTGEETFTLIGLDNLAPGGLVTVVVDGEKTFQVKVRIDTPAELSMYRKGGILLEAIE